MSLTSRLDGFERRFQQRWVVAWMIMLIIDVAIVELAALLDAAAPSGVDASGGVSLLVGAIFSVAFVAKSVLAWIVLGGMYPRPTLGAWMSWMAVGLLALFGLYALAIAIFVPAEGGAASIGLGIYAFAFIIDFSAKLGFILAFLRISWRVVLSLAIAFFAATFVLALFGLASLFSDVFITMERYWIDDPIAAVTWSESLRWSVENFVLGASSGLAIIYGNRWHQRDVDERIFD